MLCSLKSIVSDSTLIFELVNIFVINRRIGRLIDVLIVLSKFIHIVIMIRIIN
jgi:hypothetical protein